MSEQVRDRKPLRSSPGRGGAARRSAYRAEAAESDAAGGVTRAGPSARDFDPTEARRSSSMAHTSMPTMTRTMPTDRIAFRINKPVISLPPLCGVMVDRESRHSADTKTIPRVRRPHLSRTKSSAENPQSRDRHEPSGVSRFRSFTRVVCSGSRGYRPYGFAESSQSATGGPVKAARRLRFVSSLGPLCRDVGQSLSPLPMSGGLLDLRRDRNCKVRPPPRALRDRIRCPAGVRRANALRRHLNHADRAGPTSRA